MGKEHLTYFKVENFKRFDSLELNDIGQFNLVVGDNNVGKTSLLEALTFSEDPSQLFQTFHKLLFDKNILIHPIYSYLPSGQIELISRPKENFLKYIFNSLNSPLVYEFDFQLNQKYFIFLEYKDVTNIPREEFDRYSPEGYFTGMAYHFVSNNQIDDRENKLIGRDLYRFYNSEVGNLELPLMSISQQVEKNFTESYFKVIGTSRQSNKSLVENLKFLIPRIETVEARRIDGIDYVMLGLEDSDEYLPINIFGEGVIRATNIILQILKYRGKRLMIDEIDTGIHYSRMKNFLKTVFQVATKNEVQLFMTTHSLECQQAFAEVFEESDMMQHQEKVRQFTLIEKPDGKVVVNSHTYEQLQYALEIGFDTRGGKRV